MIQFVNLKPGEGMIYPSLKPEFATVEDRLLKPSAIRSSLDIDFDVVDVLKGFELKESRFTQRQYTPKFPPLRFGFLRLNLRSIRRRWLFNDRTRPNLFPGSPVAYILCMPYVF